MQQKVLTLHVAQLSKTWIRSKFNNYSDKKKDEHIKKLSLLYKEIDKDCSSKPFDESEIKQRSFVVDYFFKNLEFLENSTFNLIPFEIVECLKYALRDWVDNHDEYIIVTSLVNNSSAFSFDPSLAMDSSYLNTVSKAIYNIDFKHKLIQINIPRFLVRDYLASVVLYHELGHFVDTFYNLSSIIVNKILDGIANKTISANDQKILLRYFPFIPHDIFACANIMVYQACFQQIYYHTREYFCDIFASQYIDKCSNHYLLYISKDPTAYHTEHPSTNNRAQLVEDFLSGKKNFFLSILTSEVYQTTGRNMEARYQQVSKDDFYRLIPIEVSNPKQLHHLLVVGWEIWLGDWQEFKTKNNMAFDLTRDQVYNVINSLIEKSVSNYIVTASWSTTKLELGV